MNVLIDSRQVQDISADLHGAVAKSGHQTLWLAMDGSDQPLPDIDGADWSPAHTCVEIPLRHPEIDPIWHPRWFALNLAHARDAHILSHSIAWALNERQPHQLRAGMGRRVSGWLLTPDDDLIHAAASHCARLMLRRAPGSPGHFLLRLHDPAVLWAVWQILTPEQKSEWLGPIGRWLFLDPAGELSLLEGSAPRQNEPVGSLSHPLSAQQWQDIQNITPLHRAIQSLLAAEPTGSAPYKRWFQSGLQALRRANTHRLNDLHSLSLFAELALTRHPDFDQHPRVQQLLMQREADEPLGGLLSDLTEQDWRSIAVDLGQPMRPA